MPETAVKTEDELLAEKRARVLAMLNQEPEEHKNKIIAAAMEKVEVNKSIWKDGIAPPRFDEFFTMLDGNDLFPRQKQTFEIPGLLAPEALIDTDRYTQEFVLAAGKGCQSGETPLTDAVTGETLTMYDWARLNRPMSIRTTDGHRTYIERSPGVGCGGVAPMFTVTFEDGRHIRCTGRHGLMTPLGWRRLQNLSVGDQVQAEHLPATIQNDVRLPCTKASAYDSPPQSFPNYTRISAIVEDGPELFYDLEVPGTHCYFGDNGVLHHNSGKNYVSAKMFAWMAYVIGCVEGYPAERFNLARTSKLTVMNIAPSASLGVETFFQPYLSVFVKHPIFDGMNPRILNESIEFSRIDPATKKEYVYLELLSKHSHSSGLDGYNLLAWIMDEADAFDDLLGKSQAELNHNVLRSSCATRMGRMWLGFVTSYIRVAEGFMDRLRDRAAASMLELGEKSTYYTDTAASWEWNLKISRDDPTIVEDYKNDPDAASAKYECVAEGTMVVDECGLVPIENAPNAISKGERETLVLKTRYGYEIVVTPDHLLLMANGDWRESRCISVGDEVLINQTELAFGKTDADIREAELLGQMVGDGSMSKGKNNWNNDSHTVQWVYDPKDYDVLERQKSFLEELGWSTKVYSASRAIAMCLRTKGGFDRFTELIGNDLRLKSWDKRVPKWIFQSSKEVVAAFLSGLFEADGSINKNYVVCYGSTSEMLVRDVQQLLLLFGITGQIHWHASRYNEPWGNTSKQFWTLQLSPFRSEVFVEKIGFISKRKRSRGKNATFGNHRYYRMKSGMDLFPDVVSSISEGGVRKVYDLLDRPQSRFVANGFIAHNCKAMATISGFFEFPERITQAVDYSREPVAEIEPENIEVEVRAGNILYYVSAKVAPGSTMRRTAGYTYFLGSDAGEKGDAFALCVGHVDDQEGAYAWLCPRCGKVPEIAGGGHYEVMKPNDTVTWDGKATAPMCGACMEFADIVSATNSGGKFGVGLWYRRSAGNEHVIHAADGTALDLSVVTEDLLVRIVPLRANREGQVNRTVYFPGMLDLCKDLINGLGIYSGRFDPWQTTYITQSLKSVGTGDFDEIKCGRLDQYRRASLVKMMLYNGMLVLLPNEHRDREWRRLQRLGGNKIDHPEGTAAQESKDLFDAESTVVWQACCYRDSKIETLWLGKD